MIKRVFSLLLLGVVLLTFTSCGLDYRYALDESLHDQIECGLDEQDLSYLIYQGEKYIYAGNSNLFPVITYKVEENFYLSYDDILLSWNGYRYVWYIDEYYSYTTDSPLFIYNERLRWVYFREDYNYWTDTFLIGDTEEEIVFENIFDCEQDSFDFVNPVRVVLSSKQCPRIKISVEITSVNDQRYISLSGTNEVWIPSDQFIEILIQNRLI